MANIFLELLKEMNEKMQEINYRKEVMNITDLSNYTGWSKSYLYQLTSNRIIPHYQPIGKTIFFRRTEIDRWIFRHKIPTTSELLEGHEKKQSRLRKEKTAQKDR